MFVSFEIYLKINHLWLHGKGRLWGIDSGRLKISIDKSAGFTFVRGVLMVCMFTHKSQ